MDNMSTMNRLMRVLRSLVIKRKQHDLGSRLLAEHVAVTSGLMDKPLTLNPNKESSCKA